MRSIELTQKGFDSIAGMKQSQAKDLLLWLCRYVGEAGKQVDQSKFLLDLNKAQETALSKPTTIPLSNLFNSLKTKWMKEGIVVVTNHQIPKQPKLSRLAEMQTYIEKLEGLLLENNIGFTKQVWVDPPKPVKSEAPEEPVAPTPIEQAIEEAKAA